MKKILMAFMAVALLFSCTDDDNTNNTEGAMGTIALQAEGGEPATSITIAAGPDGKTANVAITSSSEWRVSGICDWARPLAERGATGATLSFEIDANTTNDRREATFKVFSEAAVATVTITSDISYNMELASEPTVDITKSAQQLGIRLDTNIDELSYELSGNGAEWVEFVSKNVGFGFSTLVFNVLQSDEYADRTTTFTVKGLDYTEEVVLTQAQWDEIIPTNVEYKTDYTYPNTALGAQRWEIEIQSNVNYTAAVPDWVTIEQAPVDRAEGDVGLTTQTLIFTTEATATARAGTITLAGTGAQTITIPVGQVDPAAQTYTLTDANLAKKLNSLGLAIDLGSGVLILSADPATVTSLNLASSSIASIEGLEQLFPNLTTLDLSRNLINHFDATAFTTITSLSLNRNALLTVDLGSNDINRLAFDMYYGFNYTDGPVVFKSEKLYEITANNSFYGMDDRTLNAVECPALRKVTLGTSSWYGGNLILSATHHEGNPDMQITAVSTKYE